MDLTGAAALRRSLPSAASPVVSLRGRRRRMPDRVSCAGRGGGGFADDGHLRYYEAGMKTVAGKLGGIGIFAGDASREKILKEETELLLLQELNQMKEEEEELKKRQREAKAVMKALKQQHKEAKKAAARMNSLLNCEDSSSSESSESECEQVQSMNMSRAASAATSTIEQSRVMPMVVPQIAGSATGTVPVKEGGKAAMKAMKKKEKEEKKAAKKTMKMMKKKNMITTLNLCRDEDISSCSSESSDSECEGELVRMSRCTTITAPQTPPASTLFPIVVPQISEAVALDAEILSGPANATLCTTSSITVVEKPTLCATRSITVVEKPTLCSTSSITVVEKPTLNRIEVCMGGKCKKSGALALLQEFEKEVGTGGSVVGCKCLGKCGQGPNVRLRSSKVTADSSVPKKMMNPLCIGVGLGDVGAIVAGFLAGDGDLSIN